jgi:hypothetical protein
MQDAPDPKPSPRFPEVWLTRALYAVAALSTLWLLVQILMYGYGRDQGIYATVADTILRGGMPYRDAWDFKPPGIFVVFAVTRALLGHGQWAIRLVEVLGLGSMIYALTILSRRFFGDAKVGILGGALAVLVHAQLEFWHTAQPESFGGIVLIWAIVAATYESSDRRRQLAAWALSGALYAAAGLLKPPLVGGAAVSALFVSLRLYRARSRFAVSDWLLPASLMAAGGTLIVCVCALWFVARGAWRDLYETLFVFTPHYTSLGWKGYAFSGLLYYAFEQWSVGYSSIIAFFLVPAIVMRPVFAREREGLWHVLGIVFVQLVGVTMQRKFFPYHYGATFLLAGFLAGLGVYKAWRLALAHRFIGVSAFCIASYASLFGRTATRDTDEDFLHRCLQRQSWLLTSRSAEDKAELDGRLYSVADVSYAADYDVAMLLRERLSPADRVFIWGFEPLIYDLSERRPASRYIYNVPQRVPWFRETAQARLIDDLYRTTPKAIVVEHRDVFPIVTGNNLDSADSLKQFPALRDLIARRYDLDTTIEDFDVYFARD